MLGFILSEALRDLRRAGRVAVSAVVLIGVALVAVGGFWVLSANLGRVIAEWRSRVRVVAYLKGEPAAGEVAGLLQRVQEGGDVVSAVYVGKADALESLRRTLGKDAPVLDQLPSNPLPALIEVTLLQSEATPEAARAVIARLGAMPEVEEVVGGVEWVDHLAHWQRLLQMVGLGVGGLLTIAAVLTVTTATTLVLHTRRPETEIMRLVGADESVVRLPLLLQGMLQGLLGALLALVLLAVAYHVFAPRLDPILGLTVGLPHLHFLPATSLVILVIAGTVLGGFGGYLARAP